MVRMSEGNDAVLYVTSAILRAVTRGCIVFRCITYKMASNPSSSRCTSIGSSPSSQFNANAWGYSEEDTNNCAFVDMLYDNNGIADAGEIKIRLCELSDGHFLTKISCENASLFPIGVAGRPDGAQCDREYPGSCTCVLLAKNCKSKEEHHLVLLRCTLQT